MKMNQKLVSILVVVTFLTVTFSANAQKGKAKPKAAAKAGKSSSSSNPFGGGAASSSPFGGNTTVPSTPSTGGTIQNSSSSANPFGGSAATSDPFGGGKPAQPPQGKPAGGFNKGLPITVQKSAGGDPLTDTIKPNLRNTSAISFMTNKERVPLAFDGIREDDGIYRHKLWEVIDCREKINLPFMYKDDGSINMFFTILVRSILEDSVAAFEHYDFRKQLKNSEVQAKCTGGMDTANSYDLEGNVIGLSVGKKEFPIDSVYKFQLLEEIIFDKEASKLVRRIIAIAPMGPAFIGGKIIPGEMFPYFWVYYPDLRKTLAKRQVYNPRNLNSMQTWEDYLENHMYSYYIVKSSIDNVKDQALKEYIKDPLFRLLEGEKIKSQIFNYEQGLWAY